MYHKGICGSTLPLKNPKKPASRKTQASRREKLRLGLGHCLRERLRLGLGHCLREKLRLGLGHCLRKKLRLGLGHCLRVEPPLHRRLQVYDRPRSNGERDGPQTNSEAPDPQQTQQTLHTTLLTRMFPLHRHVCCHHLPIFRPS